MPPSDAGHQAMTDNPRPVEERDALAAKLFPREWAVVAKSSGRGAGKKRNKLRNQAEEKVRFDTLKAEGKSCASCGGFERRQPYPGLKGAWCSMDSDWEGYTHAEPGGLCLKWHPKEGHQAMRESEER